MKKITKKFFALVASTLMITTIFANESAFSKATNGTIEDDASYLMNLNKWNELNFKNNFIFTSIDSTASGNVGFATHINKNNILMLNWEGNLWSNNNYNDFSALFGFNKVAILLGYQWANEGFDFDGTSYGAEYNVFKAGIGFNPNNKFELAADFSYVNIGDLPANTSYSDIIINAGFAYYFNKDASKISALGLSYTLNNFSMEVAGFSNSIASNMITPSYKLQMNLSKTVTYGLLASMPMIFTDGSSEFNFVIENGLAAQLSPLFTLCLGMETSLPSITKLDGSDAITGNFSNTFSFGGSFNLSSDIKIDAKASFTPANGISLDELWNTNFSFSVSAKL